MPRSKYLPSKWNRIKRTKEKGPTSRTRRVPREAARRILYFWRLLQLEARLHTALGTRHGRNDDAGEREEMRRARQVGSKKLLQRDQHGSSHRDSRACRVSRVEPGELTVPVSCRPLVCRPCPIVDCSRTAKPISASSLKVNSL